MQVALSLRLVLQRLSPLISYTIDQQQDKTEAIAKVKPPTTLKGDGWIQSTKPKHHNQSKTMPRFNFHPRDIEADQNGDGSFLSTKLIDMNSTDIWHPMLIKLNDDGSINFCIGDYRRGYIKAAPFSDRADVRVYCDGDYDSADDVLTSRDAIDMEELVRIAYKLWNACYTLAEPTGQQARAIADFVDMSARPANCCPPSSD